MMKNRKVPTTEEHQLGLDPNKYTKKPFNPKDYIKESLGNHIDKMREGIQGGPGMPDQKLEDLELSPSEIQQIKDQMIYDDPTPEQRLMRIKESLMEGANSEDEIKALMRAIEKKPHQPLPPKRK